MIIVGIRGGFGTQLFCYALGRHLEERSTQQIKYDDQSTWDIYLENLETDFEYADETDLNSVFRSRICKKASLEWGRSRYLEGARLIARYVPCGAKPAAKGCNLYVELKPRGKPDASAVDWPQRRRFYQPILDISGDAYLYGHWQSPKYFADIREILESEFTVRDGLSGKNRELEQQIESTDSIGVHIRRGAAERRGNALPKEYYHKAADFVLEEVTDPHLFIFSDDPQWTKENLSFDHPTTYVTHNGSEPQLDFELLKHCDHQIKSASTFSWWAAWLNGNKNKIVTVPNPWQRFGHSQERVETWEYIPHDWNFIKYA